ncbi:MAG TPA: hypothetical protein VD907_06655 [Verrucomicrobiae bacterium]|nr:hypothetical protein [Verrucomicrobiae bacterium]
MANEVYLPGENLLLWIWDNTEAIPAWEPAACLTSNSLTDNWSFSEQRNKCNPGQTVRTQTGHNYEVGFELEFINTEPDGDTARQSYNSLRKKAIAGTIDWKFAGPDGQAVQGLLYSGTAYMSNLALTAPAGDEVVTASGTLLGVGDVTEGDIHASTV